MFPLGIAFEGALEISVDDVPFRLTGNGQELTLELEDPGPFFRALGGINRDRLVTLREAAVYLDQVGLTVRILNKGQLLVTLGRDAKPGLSGYVVPHLQIGVADALRLITS